MIVPDVNLLIFAYNRAAPQHPNAKAWWENTLNADVSLAFA
jgi:predicted nucleic acid-binding protein